MRTRTTTREGTATRAANYPLKLFLYEKGWKDLIKVLERVQCTKVVTDARELTDDPEKIEIIFDYMKKSKLAR